MTTRRRILAFIIGFTLMWGALGTQWVFGQDFDIQGDPTPLKTHGRLQLLQKSPSWIAMETTSIPATVRPTRTIVLTQRDGKSATIDFEGEKVTYSGELPVDDAAKVFFDAVFKQMRECK